MAKAIAGLQEPILKAGSAPKTYSLYIGIPFCPSRCSYCSFVSCNLDRDRKLVQPYVDCLCREVEAIRDEADKAGLKLCSIYIGGGTPTSLSAAQLRQLMGTVRDCFDLSTIVEYTVEAGRPDCTDAEKLAVIREYGATRISINPQTFSDEVLANIGRRHSAQDILDCYAEARAAGHDDINMDLIAGLPGDTVEGFEKSLRQAIALDPENITVHTRPSSGPPASSSRTRRRTTTPMWPPCWKGAICWPRRAIGPTTSIVRKIPSKTWKTWAGASRATRGIIISISWKRSRPSSRPAQAAAPSWWPTAASGCSASSISSIRQNTSSVSTKCWNGKKEWLFL